MPQIAGRTQFVLAAVAIVTMLACGSGRPTSVAAVDYTLLQAADSIPLPYRQDVKVGDVWMTFANVPTDSRCPQGVTCVWAGDAVAEIVVHPGCYKSGCKAASIPLALHTNLDPRGGEGWGHRVQLLSLTPEPVHGVETVPARYVAWVRVSR